MKKVLGYDVTDQGIYVGDPIVCWVCKKVLKGMETAAINCYGVEVQVYYCGEKTDYIGNMCKDCRHKMITDFYLKNETRRDRNIRVTEIQAKIDKELAKEYRG